MAVSIPIVNDRWPLCRIIVAKTFALGVGPWQILPMWSKKRRGYGIELLSCSRVALPAVGEAKLRYRFGRIDGDLVGELSAATTASMLAGAGFSPSTDSIGAPDLRGHEVRIQLAPYVADDVTPVWRTEWWGQVEYQEDAMVPGAANPMGERTYHCVDGFARTRRWPMNRHSAYLNSVFYSHSPGHPGYNVGENGTVRGNCSGVSMPGGNATLIPADIDSKYLAHCWPGAGSAWSDQQAIEHALRIGRGDGEPLFDLYGTDAVDLTNPLRLMSQGSTAWAVDESETAFDFVSRVCRRQRGRGLVYVDWADDTNAPMGTLSVRLTVRPQVEQTLSYTTSWGPPIATSTLPGAFAAATLATVDLIGDHRVDDDSFRLGDRDGARYDCVESAGERIEVAVTLSSLDGSLANRWSADLQAAFLVIAATKRGDENFDPVFQSYGIPRSWNLAVMDHNAGASVSARRCDYRCDDTGTLSNPPPIGQQNDTSPVAIEVLPDLPFLDGYDYTTATAIPRSGGSETGEPSRRPPLPFIRKAANRYIGPDAVERRLTIYIGADSIRILSPDDKATGARVIGNTATSGLNSSHNTSTLGVTVALRLPHHVRMMDYGTNESGVVATSSTFKRKLTINHGGLQLWLAAPGCVWDLDQSTLTSEGCTPRRSAMAPTGGLPGVLRDDRPALGLLHALACSWYLSNRRTATWALRACGLLPSFQNVTDTASQASATVAYPRLGHLVTTIAAGGQTHDVGTPITSVSYDHQRGTTTWATDWSELDFR
ncbi:MAG: hypothetical protein H0W72_06955 [Planctomycetes bacterium]|nr:hypothetical protein [Planctomycetota bacterium]